MSAQAAIYACASHWNGAACSNDINVSKTLVQSVMLAGIKADLRDDAIVTEVEARVRAAIKQSRPRDDQGKRFAELGREIEHLTDAIASGLLKHSPASATRLQAAEQELERLISAKAAPRVGASRGKRPKAVFGDGRYAGGDSAARSRPWSS